MADYGMLAYVLNSCRNGQRLKIGIDLLDICKAPLRICEWYINKYNITLPIKPIEIDVRDLIIKGQVYNLIVTDAFLTRFKKREHYHIVREWKRILKKNGAVITTIRINNKKNGAVKPTKNEVNKFIQQAKNKAEDWNNATLEGELDIQNIEKLAQQYANKIVSYPFKDENCIKKLFKKAGFSKIEINKNRTKGEFSHTTYAEVVAYK
jgi:ubiquinone/menaquinone biosynthesis C-methylase UbiE